jgi:cytochrome c-type biogenesis protein CcmH
MIVWYLTVIIVLLTILSLLLWLLKNALHRKIILACSSLVMTCVLIVNPDIVNWYQFIQQQKALQLAHAILKQPKQVEMLLERLQQAVVEHPNDAKAWFLLGRIYAANQDWPHAHDALLQAYRRHPNDIKTALFYVETIWHTQGRITHQAHVILQSVLKTEPNQPDALLMLATDAKEHQCFVKAIGYWKRVLVLFPKDSKMYKILLEVIDDAKKQRDNCK